MLTFQVANGELVPPSTQDVDAIQLSTLSGGAMNLTFYF
jgi:hypothetical protein